MIQYNKARYRKIHARIQSLPTDRWWTKAASTPGVSHPEMPWMHYDICKGGGDAGSCSGRGICTEGLRRRLCVYRIMPNKRTVHSQNFPLAISTALSLKSAPPYARLLQLFFMSFKQNRKKRIDKHETINQSILLRFYRALYRFVAKKEEKN